MRTPKSENKKQESKRMKTCVAMLAAIAFGVLSGCGGNMTTTIANPTPTPVVGTQNQWTWMAGSNMANQPGTYGTLGTPGTGNTPGGRENPVNWTDKSGNLWLFGGMEIPSATQDNFRNDLWKFSGGQWTWMGGSNSVNQAGIYGTMGTPALGNIPGARFQAVSWTDASGNFWLFGGLGLDANGTSEFLNDLWKFDGSQWTWM